MIASTFVGKASPGARNLDVFDAKNDMISGAFRKPSQSPFISAFLRTTKSLACPYWRLPKRGYKYFNSDISSMCVCLSVDGGGIVQRFDWNAPMSGEQMLLTSGVDHRLHDVHLPIDFVRFPQATLFFGSSVVNILEMATIGTKFAMLVGRVFGAVPQNGVRLGDSPCTAPHRFMISAYSPPRALHD